jgi:ribose transport system ATP-binding protein
MHSLKDNVSLPNYKGLSSWGFIRGRSVKKMSNESIKELNIKTDSIDKRLINLSGGNQQKVVVAKWIKTEPKIFLMDEPTAGIDIGAKAELINIIRGFTEGAK